jgi:maltose O-acetyltransferase
MLRHLVNIILYYLPPTRLFSLRRLFLKLSGTFINKNAKFSGRSWIYGRGKLTIEKNTWLSPGVVFYTHIDSEIFIGKNCDIGPDVKFIIGSHEIGPSKRRAGKGTSNPIIIHEGCWIGANAIILEGVTVGKGSIIAAGAVVNKDIKENILVAGVPSIFKKNLN